MLNCTCLSCGATKTKLVIQGNQKSPHKAWGNSFDWMGILTRQDVNDSTNPLYQRGDDKSLEHAIPVKVNVMLQRKLVH